tara:strand:+ start:4547 stop:4810 length:264 start_codon:yes stop_codon:yes gene_type:complete
VKKKQYVFGFILFLIYSVVAVQATNLIVGLLHERELNKQNDRLREVITLAKSKLEAELYRDVFFSGQFGDRYYHRSPVSASKLDQPG